MGAYEFSASSFALAAGIALLTMILLRRSWRYERRRRVRAEARSRSSRTPTLRPPAETDPLIDAPPEVLRWHVALHETARDLQGQLDSKIVIVNRLVLQAREEAERLEALLAREEGSTVGAPHGPLEPERARQTTRGER